MPTRHVLWAVLALLLAGCTPSLGAVFDATPAYPGYTWTRDGRSVKPEELGTIAGPGHCGWESATFLTIGWPVGTLSKFLGASTPIHPRPAWRHTWIPA